MKPPADPVAHDQRAHLVAQLRLVGTGDTAAMAQVYMLTCGKLNALLLRMTGDATVAEELLQDVYVSVWRRAATFDPTRASPITWLAAIARNRALDHLRAQRSRGLKITSDIPLELPDPGPSVIDVHVETEEQHRLLACMKRLETRQQAAIRSAFFEGFTYEMLADRAGVPLGTMKSWIRRGLLRLRDCLHEEPLP